jgi:cytochrome c oxidase cbb3-type subunit III
MRWLSSLIFAAVACFAAGCGPRVDAVVPDGKEPPSEAAQQGKQLYDKYCKLCHGEDARGYSADHANQLANAEFLRSAPDQLLVMGIDQGRPGTPMSAFGKMFGGPLALEQERKIVAYLRSLGEGRIALQDKPAAGDPAAGETLFKARCAKCHGEKAEGKTALSLSNPVFLMTAPDDFIRYGILKGRPGTPMPAFEKELAAADVENLVAFIRSLARNVESLPRGGEPPPSFDTAVIHPDGPDPAFGALREGRYVPAAEVKAAFDKRAKMVLLDARPTSDWLLSHIPGALPVPYYDADRMAAKLPKDGTWIIAYCGCPHAASGHVMDMLREKGFPKTAVIDEGIFEWIRRGYPITYGKPPATLVPE